MALLPRERLIRRSAPESVELILALEIAKDQVCQPRAKGLFGWFDVHVLFLAWVLLLKLQLEASQGIQEYSRVVNLSHGLLVVMHLIQVVFRVAGQERLHHFDRIAELLERDPHSVNGILVPCIQLADACSDFGICPINRLEKPLCKVCIIGSPLDGVADLLDSLVEI